MQSMWRKKDRLESGETGNKEKPAKSNQGKIKTACWSGKMPRGESWYPFESLKSYPGGRGRSQVVVLVL